MTISKRTLSIIVFALLALLAAERSYRAYQWKQIADKRGFYAEQAGAYLFAPSGVTTPSGQPVNRAELTDFLLKQVIEQLAKDGKLKVKQ